MSLPAGGLRFPRYRVLLPRTRLAYVHLRNLFTDAKRDRGARVFGYVCVWLPDEFLLFYMQEGEIVNATSSPDGQRFHPIAIADAVARVPREAEYGEVCFHEADDEQLAMMYWTQMLDPAPWPPDVNAEDAAAVLGFLRATMHDGVLEVIHDEGRSYAVVREGVLVRGYFSDDAFGAPEEQVRALLAPADRWVRLRLWPVPPRLPAQAAPALIQGYRELMANAVRRLQKSGVDSALTIAEHARRNLIPAHPALDRMAVSVDAPSNASLVSTLSFGRTAGSSTRDPITEARPLSAAVGAWLAEILWTTPPADGTPPEIFLEDLLRERRHMFQGAGLFETLPWKLFV
ncbi:MAG TPA: hypothetical protein VG916_04410 [Gemmatimonadaceae bacterium]|nr:hypothetical protein [Gemmatimonadaceae bacterium]